VLSRLKNIFDKHFGPGSTFYGILKPCRRCVYQNFYEPILILSKERGPRIIIIPSENKCYVRVGKCLGYQNCGKCFIAVKEDIDVPCKWRRF